MKKLLLVLAFSLLALNVVYADDSYETAFKKALDNHQYYFKHKGKNYTTDTKDKNLISLITATKITDHQQNIWLKTTLTIRATNV